MDGVLDINDISLIVEWLLTGKEPAGYHGEYADLNNDKVVSVDDISILVEQILKKE